MGHTPFVFNILPIFARERGGLHTAAMKRETGENPVQSRCCMFLRRKHTNAIDSHELRRRACRNKSEDLPPLCNNVVPSRKGGDGGYAWHRFFPFQKGRRGMLVEHLPNHHFTYLIECSIRTALLQMRSSAQCGGAYTPF